MILLHHEGNCLVDRDNGSYRLFIIQHITACFQLELTYNRQKEHVTGTKGRDTINAIVK